MLTDISGRSIPAHPSKTSSPRVLAVPPIRDVPSRLATEIVFDVFAQIGIGSSAPMVPSGGAASIPRIQDYQRGRLNQIILMCGDLTANTNPYLLFTIFVNQQRVPAWSQVPLFPKTGLGIVTLPATIDLPPNTTLSFLGENTDVGAHFFGAYVHGWVWPKDAQEG